MKKHASTMALLAIFFLGLSLLLYPAVSSYWNSIHQSQTIAAYSEEVSGMAQKDYQRVWQEASRYNEALRERGGSFRLSEAEKKRYQSLLDISGTGIMGYIEIPAIKVALPIYHGVDDGVLQVAVGHLDWTSLPVGGVGTHCVLSGHRGLPSSTLFTHLDRVEKGDLFHLRVLDEVLSYEVDQIRIVKPDQVYDLLAEDNRDLCTLVTCTPYGVNSHRLLVRGHRVQGVETETMLVTADALQIEPILVASVLAAPMLLILLCVMLFYKRKR